MNKKIYKDTFSQVHSSCDNKLEVIMIKYNTKKELAGLFGKYASATLNAFKTRKKPAMVAAALAVMMMFSLTVYAVVGLLTPAQIAERAGDHTLAEAFQSDDFVPIEESVTSEGYIFTLHGFITGENLSNSNFTVNGVEITNKTHFVFSVRNADGTPINLSDPDPAKYKRFHPCVLFEGYKPWILSSFSFGAGGSWFEEDGVLYMLFECSENIEMFAGRTVYFAIWDGELGFAPGSELFKANPDGTIEFVDGLDKAHAMFTLPLDPAKADQAKIDKFLEDLGIAKEDVCIELAGTDDPDDVVTDEHTIVVDENADSAGYSWTQSDVI